MLIKNLMLLICLSFFIGNASQAQTFEYIGAKKCKMCHNKLEKGQQFTKWSEAKHANAMKTLSGTKAMEYAKANGIANPATDSKCTKCHSTAGSVDKGLLAETITTEEGVSCESCHGPGSAYKSSTVMKSQEQSIAKGLVIPNEQVCVGCHNKDNPFHKPFNFAEYSKKIAHPNPMN